MDIVIAVAAKIAELTVEPFVMQVKYLVCYRNNLEELNDLVKELQTTKECIDRKVEAERRNGRVIERDVLNWQESVPEILKEAKKVYEDPNDANVRCFKWYFPNLKSRYQHGRKAKKIANTIFKMNGKAGNFGDGVGYVPPLDIANTISTPRGSDKLESRKLVKEAVILCLKDPKIDKVGVYGISGVGKTILAREIFQQAKEVFDEVVMTTVSQNNLEKIQDEIAEQLGLRLEETTTIGRANRLCERIKRKKTLIILDDLWEKIDMEKLGIPSLDTMGKINSEDVEVPLRDDYASCKLLLTSRTLQILQKNDTQKHFSLDVLSPDESWSMFEAMVGDDVKNVELRKIATKVAQRCAGLPVLIAMTAKSLTGKGIPHWKGALNNLKKVDNGNMHDTIFVAFKFNFDRLKDEEQKVFLLCGVHGTSISMSYLLKYAVGLGILQWTDSVEDVRNRLYGIIDDLKASCLLVDDVTRVEMIKMHDSVREVAISIASKYVFTKINANLQEWPRKDIPEMCTHIILDHCCIQKLPETLDCPHLTFLHIDSRDNPTLEIPDSFFEGMGNLKALDLTGIRIASLPISLSSLTKLKTLCLDHCSLKDMAGIGVLKNLEILSLIHSSMEEFPSEIEQLTKLRMLDLSRSGIGTTLPNILCKLTKLEELYMGDATIKWEVVECSTRQKRNASLANLGHLTSLTTLEIQIREAWLLPKDIPFERLERYKIVIGEVWEWSCNKETLRLLKLKLDTDIRLERGIKTLIKSVEDLYLDKLSGISNVLFELNGEGFPLLKHLHIQNSCDIQHIISSMDRHQSHMLFPELETLIVRNLNNLVKICHEPIKDNSFGKLKVIKVKSCDKMEYLFHISMVKAFYQLVEIEVSECNSMKKIVLIDGEDGGQTTEEKIEFLRLHSLTLQNLPTIDDFCSLRTNNSFSANILTPFFSSKVKFSDLKTLKLSSVNSKKFWDDNQSFTPSLFQNLANLIVENCRGLKYLFSASMIGKLLILKKLEISKCDMMEEIIATEEIYDAPLGEVLFPKLEEIVIRDMQNLQTIWNPILASNSLVKFKALEVINCEKIEKIFPTCMNKAFASLETLKVEGCKSMQEIFQLDVNADDTMQLKDITLHELPQLKHIWSRGSQSSLRFKNLQVVCVEDCGDLEYLFPFSIAMNLPLLRQISIKGPASMKEIVSKGEETLDQHVNFEFNQLTSMLLWNLEDLQGFYAGNYSLSCPSLKTLDFFNCEKLKLFKARGTSSQGRFLSDNPHVLAQQPLFTLEEVIDNLEYLCMNNDDASTVLQSQVPRDHFGNLTFLRLQNLVDAQATSPYWFLQNISSLEFLVVQENHFKVIFPEERLRDEIGKGEIKTRLKRLSLYRLYALHHICREGCQLDPILDVLEYLYVGLCANLEHLVPSSVTLNHLVYLKIENCKGLIYLITSSTARSLVKLTTLKIKECDLVEQIVAEEGRENNIEIAFNCLQELELESLPKLKTFCSSSKCCLKLPVLETLVIRQCARMESFFAAETSAPLLREIITDQEDKKWFCEGDLNSTVNKMFQDKVAFSSFDHLELSEYPELKELWYDQVGQKIFSNLKHLVVCKCTFLSNTLFSSNLLQLLYVLEELEVAECDSLEAVFDVKALDDKAMKPKEVSGLKKLILSGLPHLKRIWNKEAEEIISFENLQIVKVDKCQKLNYLFSVSLCLNLKQLQELKIESCCVKQIVSIDDGSEELTFHFPHLTSLELFNLKQLTNLCLKRYTLECPSLKTLNIRGCEQLTIFAFDHLNSQALGEGDIELQIEQALFHIEKVSHNLEELPLTEKDAMRILNGNYEKNLFQSIIRLRLQYFWKTPIKLLNDLIQKFPATTKIQVRCSSFEILFPAEEIGRCSIESLSQIEELWLDQLEQLEYIWSDDDSTAHPLLPNLQDLSIWECCRLIRLAPPLTSFTNLTTLTVEDCNVLMYFMSPFTAKSLVHLTKLEVRNCDMLEEIVMTNEAESKEEITFESLKYLELTGLSGFKGFCSGKHTFIFPSLVTLKVIGCLKMQNFSYGVIIAPFLKLVEVENGKKHWREDLNTTIKQLFTDKAIKEVEGDYCIESSSTIQSSIIHQNTVSTSSALSFEEDVAESKANEIIVDSRRQELQKVLNIPQTANGPEEMKETVQMPFPEVVTLTHTSVQETVHGTQDEINERPMVQTTHQGTLGSNIVHTTDIKNQEMYKTSKEALVSVAQNVVSSSMVDNIAINPSPSQALEVVTSSIQDEATETHGSIDKPLVETTQNTWDITIVQKKEESHADIHLSKNLFIQTLTSMYPDNKGTVGAQKTYESNRRFSSVRDAQNVMSPTIVYNTGKSYDPEIISEKLSSQATNSAIVENKTNIEPSPSKVSEASSSSTTSITDFCSSFKDLDISVQLLPYLDIGVNKHPQVLGWLNSKQRRIFASFYFSLFAEVTRILRTTRKGHFTEEDQNYIRDCCSILKGVGFDESWISYVYRLIEEHEDDKEMEDEEANEASNLKAQLESMRKELASVQESLALLSDKAQSNIISSSVQVLGFSWRSICRNLFIFIIIYLFMCLLIYGLSKLPF